VMPPPAAPAFAPPVQANVPPPQLTLPDPALAQTNPPFKKPTNLKYPDPDFSPVRFHLHFQLFPYISLIHLITFYSRRRNDARTIRRTMLPKLSMHSRLSRKNREAKRGLERRISSESPSLCSRTVVWRHSAFRAGVGDMWRQFGEIEECTKTSSPVRPIHPPSAAVAFFLLIHFFLIARIHLKRKTQAVRGFFLPFAPFPFSLSSLSLSFCALVIRIINVLRSVVSSVKLYIETKQKRKVRVYYTRIYLYMLCA